VPAQAAIPVVQLEHVWKSFSHTEVLTDVSLSVNQGEVVCIIGPSGAGKSSLLRCINHLEPVNDGTIWFEGRPVYRYKLNGKTIVDPNAGWSRSWHRSAWCSRRSISTRT